MTRVGRSQDLRANGGAPRKLGLGTKRRGDEHHVATLRCWRRWSTTSSRGSRSGCFLKRLSEKRAHVEGCGGLQHFELFLP